MKGFSSVLHQPQEMAERTGKHPRGLRRLATGPFPRKPCEKGAWHLRAPESSTEGDSEAAPGAWGRGELVGAYDSENRGLLCGIQSHWRASSSAFGSEQRSCCSLLSLCAPGVPGSTASQALRAVLPGRPDSQLAWDLLSARGCELHHQHLQ